MLEIVEIAPNLGEPLGPAKYRRACDRLAQCYSVLGSKEYSVEVRPARQGEAEGTYLRTSDGNLQILNYSLDVPDDLRDLQSRAWELFCAGTRLRVGQRVFAPVCYKQANGRMVRQGRCLSDDRLYQSHKCPSGRWSHWRAIEAT